VSQLVHRAAAYGAGALSFAALAYSGNTQAVSLPFVSKVHAMALPKATQLIDQRTVGGHEYRAGRHCALETQILVRSALPLPELEAHYRAHPVTGAYSASAAQVTGHVVPIARAERLPKGWERWRNDAGTFIVDFRSPGDGEDVSCGRF
jgi:hypothetical protein